MRDIVSAVTGTELEEIDTETPLMEANLCFKTWDGRVSKTSDVTALSQAGLTSSSAIVMQETLSKASRGPSSHLSIALWLLL